MISFSRNDNVLSRYVPVAWSVLTTQRTHDAIITSLLRQNDVATSFWRNNDVIIASRVRWEPRTGMVIWWHLHGKNSQRTHDAKKRHYDVKTTSFWRHNDVIIASWPRWVGMSFGGWQSSCVNDRTDTYMAYGKVICVLCAVFVSSGCKLLMFHPLSSWCCNRYHADGLVQDCSISSALAMEILQSCTKPSMLYGTVV